MDLLKGIVLHLVFSKLHPPLISAVELTPGEQVKTMVFISKRFFPLKDFFCPEHVILRRKI